MTTMHPDRVDSTRAVANLVRWLETGSGAEETFAPDCFSDLSLPQWRIQADSRAVLAAVRAESHPVDGAGLGSVRVERVDQTDKGFVIAFEERWPYAGHDWYAREMIRADVVDDLIVDLAIACTGDWDEEVQTRHAREVGLIRS